MAYINTEIDRYSGRLSDRVCVVRSLSKTHSTPLADTDRHRMRDADAYTDRDRRTQTETGRSSYAQTQTDTRKARQRLVSEIKNVKHTDQF